MDVFQKILKIFVFVFIRYMSINAHQAKTQGRRDDLESLSYMLLYFFTGHLPWMGFTGSTIKEKYRKIKNSKEMFQSDYLFISFTIISLRLSPPLNVKNAKPFPQIETFPKLKHPPNILCQVITKNLLRT